MKTFFKSIVLALSAIVLTAALSVPTFAQDDKTKLYETYTSNYAGTIEQRRLAIKAGKEYIAKYGNNPDDKEIVDYLKGAIPALEKGIEDELKAIAEAKKKAEKQARYNKFDKSFKDKNWDAVFDAGNAILSKEPDMLDVILVLGSIGFDQASQNPPVDKYNDMSISFAKRAIAKINGGATSKNFGAYNYTYKDKNNAVGWMNYYIGMIKYHREGANDPMKKKEALNYFYNATRVESDTKKNPAIYGTLADWYFAKAVDIGKERDKLDKDDEANYTAIDNFIAMERGYADRAIDGYARALSIARLNPKVSQSYKDNLLKTIKQLYDFRYQKPEMKTEMKINTFIAGVLSTPMPHPATAVKPVQKQVTPTDTTTEVKNGNSRTRTVKSSTR